MAKSAVFGVMHVVIAFSIGWALTGSLATAGAITNIEPVADTVAHYFFDRWWSRREQHTVFSRSGEGAGSMRLVPLAEAGGHPRP